MHRKYLIHPLKAAIYVFALYQNSKFSQKCQFIHLYCLLYICAAYIMLFSIY